VKVWTWRAWILVVAVPILLGAASEAPVHLPDPLRLDWCLERAEAANPDIAADAATAEAAEHRVIPAGALDDPRTVYEASNVPVNDLDFDSTPLSGHQFRLAQKLPFPGLLDNREEAARRAADAASEQLDDRRRRVASAAEQAWTELGFAQRALAITDRNLDLLRQLAQIAEARYRVGAGLQQDVLRSQVELTMLLQERLRRVDAIRTAEAALAALLDLLPETRFPRTAALREEAPLPDLEALLGRLADTSPFLRARAAQVEEAERLRRVAVLEGYPDFDLGVGYRVRERVAGDAVGGDDFLLASVTVRLPINRTKWRERIAERDALLRRAKAELRSARARLREGVRTAFADLERADDEVELLETGLVPQTRQSLDSSRSGYQVDKVDFLSLIDSQVSLLEAELRLVRAVADRRAAFAAIEAALGESLR
jgi:cobalt-zinc-cadmium efflux system outer membrane protein